MTKTQYLQFVLEKLGDTRAPAHGIVLLIKEWVIDDNMSWKLIKVLEDAAREATNNKAKDALEKSVHLIKHINELEAQSKLEDEKEIQDLEMIIEAL